MSERGDYDGGTRLFRRAMIRELHANEHKGGWVGRERREHFRDLDYHCAKLKAAARAGDRLRVVEFAADVANHAMFIADEAGALTGEAVLARETEARYVRPGLRFWAWLLLSPRQATPKLSRVWYHWARRVAVSRGWRVRRALGDEPTCHRR